MIARHAMTIRVKKETVAGEWVEVSSQAVESDYRPSGIYSLGHWPVCRCERHRGPEPETRPAP
ncbi:hypothetical protein [Streptacidiphilus sp. P02-A3a]|uniref:hypothetical protein n=1 Tax=Streptacidiphilus sp. P02-A3a TaxID=2704468 RepID=UPI0015FD38C7|nr:hypothetical protein [Streptacidiphilus sp. P02-A3a]QMU70240.1 hypothetical protein GXP74_20485 [Streptacidiphilus sp. P02-A3a]QMU70304.1 hypothetical protein GXP74_20890 [Streptacidiphilus sp. P02-A3a]